MVQCLITFEGQLKLIITWISYYTLLNVLTMAPPCYRIDYKFPCYHSRSNVRTQTQEHLVRFNLLIEYLYAIEINRKILKLMLFPQDLNRILRYSFQV